MNPRAEMTSPSRLGPPPMALSAGSGFPTLLYKELLRFWKVSAQTITAPVLTAMLYLLIFSHVLQDRVQVYPGVNYTAFLVPGLIMMSVLQNAFANASSSLIQSKVTGNLVFVLLPPVSHFEFFAAYVIAAVVRGLSVGLGMACGRWNAHVASPRPLALVNSSASGTGPGVK